MSLETVLLVGLQVLLLFYPIVAFILIRAAVRRPYITALSLMAVLTVLIALIVIVYLVSVIGRAVEFPVPEEGIRLAFRTLLFGLALFPLWFLYLYTTRRFR